MRTIFISMFAISVLALGCTDSGSDPEEDTATDEGIDVEEDVVDDTMEEPVEDVVEEEVDPGCVYPEGPYGFQLEGEIAPPMAWTASVKGPEETYDLDHADLEQFFCDPEVQSVIVVIATTWCPYCPNRVTNLAGLQEHYETYGARFVWLLGDGTSGADSQAYFSSYGATFGWFSSDQDNTMGEHMVTGSEMLEGVPWVFVIDADSMEIIYNNPTSVYSIVRDLYND